MQKLDRSDWQAQMAAHQARVDALLADHRWRSSRGIKHPVEDFLFEYYTFRPYQLRRWHPGHGVVLADADEWLKDKHYRQTAEGDGVRLDAEAILAARARTVRQTYALLRATNDRRPSFGCFGMHEWAMVDGLEPQETRHPQLGLRFPPERVSAIVREVGVRCTHVDAYRFFTPTSRSLNPVVLTRENQVELDQPGCLHVGMDLYKSAYKLAPLIASDLIVDCFELARRIRQLDMRASAYDVSSLGLDPVAVETPEGRAEYATAQRGLADAAAPVRRRLMAAVSVLKDLATAVVPDAAGP